MIWFLLSLFLFSTSEPAPSVLKKKLEKLNRELKEIDQELSTIKTRKGKLKRNIFLLTKKEKILLEICDSLRVQERLFRKKLRQIEKQKTYGYRVLENWLNGLKYSIGEILKGPNNSVDSLIFGDFANYALGVISELSGELEELRDYERKEKVILNTLQYIRKSYELKTYEIKRTKEKKKKLLIALERERREKEKKRRELEKSRAELERLLARLERESREKLEKTGKTGRLPKRGSFIMPVDGKIIGRFGYQVDPEYGTKVKNNGIDILSKGKSPVKAVADGTVVFSGNFMAYGLMVIIDHGGFLTVYSGLGRIIVKPGQSVKVGEIIGYLPDHPGSILHFELREHGKAVNPIPYFKRGF